jgi:hypothetical protein
MGWRHLWCRGAKGMARKAALCVFWSWRCSALKNARNNFYEQPSIQVDLAGLAGGKLCGTSENDEERGGQH